MNDKTHDSEKLREQRAAEAGAIDSEQPALTRPHPRTRLWKWIAVVVAVIAAAVVGWFWFGHSSEEQAKAKGKGDPNARTMPVVAAPARKGTIDVHIDALGTVPPR